MTKEQFIRKCKSLNKRTAKINSEVRDLINTLEEMGVDLDTSSEAENASTVDEAIQCYIGYNEYNPSLIWDEMFKEK